MTSPDHDRESSFNELIKCFDESDEKWDKLIDSTKQMNNGYNDDGKLCTNENINKEATVNKVSDNNGKKNDNEVSLNVNQAKVYKVSNCLLYTSRCV